MKIKLFLFLGLFFGSIGLSLVPSNSVFAAGESYKWIDNSTIEGSGGNYDSKILKEEKDGYNQKSTPVKIVRFTRVGTTAEYKAAPNSVFYKTSGALGTVPGKCLLQLAITVDNANVGSGALRVNDPNTAGSSQCPQSGLDLTVGIGATANAPAPSSFTEASGETDATPSKCGVDGIGWIICPISDSISDGVDTVFNLIKTFLEFKSYSTDQSQGIYPAWAIMRNFANVAFVIAFLIIIYSQLTSVGITNYGIKKMLPRLIVAAILVNVSFWICGIGVDISNILGASLADLFNGLIPAVKGDRVDVLWHDATLTILSGSAVGGLMAYSAIATAGGFTALLWMLLPILISALFAVLVAILVLAARQVILIILIVISPLAFVAYLLPNTSKWYSRWQTTFITLLLMYPMIAIIFGGSQLASAIILGAEDLTMVMVLLALAVQVVPLALTPMLMKLSSGLLGQFAGIVNNPKRGPLDALRTRAKEKQDLATKSGLDPNNKGLINRMGQRRAFSRRHEKLRGEVHDSAADAAWAGKTVTDSKLQSLVQQKQSNAIAQNVAGGVNQTRTTSALASGPQAINAALGNAAGDPEIQKAIEVAVDEATSKSIKEAQISAKAELAPGDMTAMGNAFAAAVKGGDSINARALQNMLLTSGSAGIARYREVMSQSDVETALSGPDNDVSADLRKNVLDNHGGIKAAANDIIQQAVKGTSMRQASADPGSWALSDEELVHQKPASIRLAMPHVSEEQAKRIIGNEELAKNLDAYTRDLVTIKAGGATVSAPPAAAAQAPTINVQPGTLNVNHNLPPNANPGNYRVTPPSSSGNSQSPGGVILPDDYRQPPPNP